jgi:hypothetical protein|tara:strand:- start:124 stop:636 length:513 start_codon:yes stop_codon:yes gene_type:complete
MGKLEDRVNEILGVESKPNAELMQQKEFKPPVAREEDKEKQDVDNDHKNSREYYYNLIEKGQEAIQGILDVAKEGQHPRAYEVALAGIKNVADTVDKLQDLNKKLKDLKELPKSASPQIKNALFVGSTTDLQKMLKDKKEPKDITPEKFDENNRDTKDDPFKGTPIEGKD